LKRKKTRNKVSEAIDPLAKLEKIKRLGVIAMFSDDFLMERLTLKGGNAIDLVHKTPCRASVDLDFSMDTEFDEQELGAIKERIEKALVISFRTGGYEVFDIDFSIKPPEHKLSPDMADFWGGYRIEFKLIESGAHERFATNLRDLQMNAVEVNLPLNKKKVFKIEISKYEYCIPKQRHELDDYTIYVYTPEMIVIEKLRAICQQMAEYAEIVTSPSRSARARDFFDIYMIMEHFKIDLTTHQNIELIKNIFSAKKVPVSLIRKIGEYREYHRPDFEAVNLTVKPGIDLKDYDFYFDYVLEVSRMLKVLWEE
jgi:predicted nucleotidyltransferase component of viral defense system